MTVIRDEASPANSRVEVAAVTCLDSGWLEQVACAPSTREHESLMVIETKPSQVHLALMMAGFEPGAPGRWKYENKTFTAIPPAGEQCDIRVRYVDATGKTVEHPVGEWMQHPAERDAEPKPFPRKPWVFGGSSIAKNKSGMDEGEHYVADMTGSIIGLVTFGDETLGFSQVLSDQDAVQEPVWEVNPSTMPRVGTAVTIIIRRWNAGKNASS